MSYNSIVSTSFISSTVKPSLCGFFVILVLQFFHVPLVFGNEYMPVISLESITNPKETNNTGLPEISWTEENDESWKKESPLFFIESDNGELKATGWAAITKKNILFKIIVKEADQSNSESGAKIYNGSSVQIGIDVRGDGVGNLPKNSEYVGEDDATICFALTDEGPKAWAHHIHENRFPETFDGNMPQLISSIERDESTQTTTYNLVFPWSEFRTPAGFSQYMGLCVIVNSGKNRNRQQIKWGEGASHIPRPGLMKKVRIANPPEFQVSSITTKSELWINGDYGENIVSLFSPLAHQLNVKIGNVEKEFQIPETSGKNENRQFALKTVYPKLPKQPISIQLKLINSKNEVVLNSTEEFQIPGIKKDEVISKITNISNSANQPLLKQSFDALQQAIEVEWQRSLKIIKKENNSAYAHRTLRYMAKMDGVLNEDMADWKNYLNRRYPLLISFKSPIDGHFNISKLLLPLNWKPRKKYPLVVYLHGSGVLHNIQFITDNLSLLELNVALSGDAAKTGDFYELRPFVGEHRYWDRGEVYVWEQIDYFLNEFKIDEDRQYLGGSSMGGMGTWSMGLRTPDRWAALLISAARPFKDDMKIGLGRNASNLPVLITHGDNDQIIYVENAFAIRDELKKWGNNPFVKIYPGFGHGMPKGEYSKSVEWLLKHRRKRPDQFAYVSDSERYSGCWGITLSGDRTSDQKPSFKCSIKEQIVYITTQNIEKLDVDLGKSGLKLKGKITIILNGEKVYYGKAKLVHFDETAKSIF